MKPTTKYLFSLLVVTSSFSAMANPIIVRETIEPNGYGAQFKPDPPFNGPGDAIPDTGNQFSFTPFDIEQVDGAGNRISPYIGEVKIGYDTRTPGIDVIDVSWQWIDPVRGGSSLNFTGLALQGQGLGFQTSGEERFTFTGANTTNELLVEWGLVHPSNGSLQVSDYALLMSATRTIIDPLYVEADIRMNADGTYRYSYDIWNDNGLGTVRWGWEDGLTGLGEARGPIDIPIGSHVIESFDKPLGPTQGFIGVVFEDGSLLKVATQVPRGLPVPPTAFLIAVAGAMLLGYGRSNDRTRNNG